MYFKQNRNKQISKQLPGGYVYGGSNRGMEGQICNMSSWIRLEHEMYKVGHGKISRKFGLNPKDKQFCSIFR